MQKSKTNMNIFNIFNKIYSNVGRSCLYEKLVSWEKLLLSLQLLKKFWGLSEQPRSLRKTIRLDPTSTEKIFFCPNWEKPRPTCSLGTPETSWPGHWAARSSAPPWRARQVGIWGKMGLTLKCRAQTWVEGAHGRRQGLGPKSGALALENSWGSRNFAYRCSTWKIREVLEVHRDGGVPVRSEGSTSANRWPKLNLKHLFINHS